MNKWTDAKCWNMEINKTLQLPSGNTPCTGVKDRQARIRMQVTVSRWSRTPVARGKCPGHMLSEPSSDEGSLGR